MSSVIVIFSFGMSLNKWQEMGILKKEINIFNEYISRGLYGRVYLFTYNKKDQSLLVKLKENGIVNEHVFILTPSYENENLMRKISYSFFSPILKYKKEFKDANALYTNQTSGSWVAAISKILYGNRFVYRYGHSLWRRHLDRKQFHRLIFSYLLDKFMNAISDYNLVCTKGDYSNINKFFLEKSSICPNYIDADKYNFNVSNIKQRENKAIFVGRLTHFKNLENLIKAVSKLDLKLDIVGDGPMKNELISLSKDLGANCNFLGIIDNIELQNLIRNYKIFFLVSNYEGMPKALLEGMASGCLCIVSPHQGCTEIIEHNVNGIVCKGFSAESIEYEVNRIDLYDIEKISISAQESILSKYSLNNVIKLHSKAYGII